MLNNDFYNNLIQKVNKKHYDIILDIIDYSIFIYI